MQIRTFYLLFTQMITHTIVVLWCYFEKECSSFRCIISLRRAVYDADNILVLQSLSLSLHHFCLSIRARCSGYEADLLTNTDPVSRETLAPFTHADSGLLSKLLIRQTTNIHIKCPETSHWPSHHTVRYNKKTKRHNLLQQLIRSKKIHLALISDTSNL